MTHTLPPLNWLRVFEAAARYQSFARAASELNMSAAAVSQQMRALETRLDAALFLRHAHAVTLTDSGRAYLPTVQQALVSLSEATEGIFGPDTQDTLFVQAVPLFANGVLAAGCVEFTQAHPGISLTLNTEFYSNEQSGRYHDLRINFGAVVEGDTVADTILGERLFPVATPALAQSISGPADLLNYPLIDVSQHWAGWSYLFVKLGFASRAAQYIHTDNTVTACAIAASGAGIALARSPASDTVVSMAGLQPCLEGFSVQGTHSYHLTHPDHVPLRKPAQLFRDWLVGYCAGL